jgi:5-methylcytosine-specific restriction enzyme A
VPDKGSPHGHSQRAVERGDVLAALVAARQLGTLSLSDALALTALLAEKEPDRFRRTHIPVGQQRCPTCATEYERGKRERKRTRQQQGYDRHWYVLARQALAAQPWCSYCGTTEDLVVDHIGPTTRGHSGLTLAHVQTLCRACNSRKGNRKPPDLPRVPPPEPPTDILIA